MRTIYTEHADYPAGVREIFDVAAYVAAYPDSARAITTCGTCSRVWDDSHTSYWTPAPSARCPFEYDHCESEES